jgi:hypothetical protein
MTIVSEPLSVTLVDTGVVALVLPVLEEPAGAGALCSGREQAMTPSVQEARTNVRAKVFMSIS